MPCCAVQHCERLYLQALCNRLPNSWKQPQVASLAAKATALSPKKVAKSSIQPLLVSMLLVCALCILQAISNGPCGAFCWGASFIRGLQMLSQAQHQRAHTLKLAWRSAYRSWKCRRSGCQPAGSCRDNLTAYRSWFHDSHHRHSSCRPAKQSRLSIGQSVTTSKYQETTGKTNRDHHGKHVHAGKGSFWSCFLMQGLLSRQQQC